MNKILIICVIFFSQSIFAYGFDCKLASTSAEKFICSDESIFKKDKELSNVYEKAKQYASNIDTYKSSQITWLTLRDKCNNRECFIDTYNKRIALLYLSFPDTNYLQNDCSSIGSVGTNIAACESENLEKRQIEMYKILAKIDRDMAYQSAVDDFFQSQRLWEEYSNFHCKMKISLRGDWGAMQRAICLNKKTLTRINDLKLLNCEENGCYGHNRKPYNREDA